MVLFLMQGMHFASACVINAVMTIIAFKCMVFYGHACPPVYTFAQWLLALRLLLLMVWQF
jgi:hypothetical protein